MARLFLASALLLASCSSAEPKSSENRVAEPASQSASDPRYFVGKPFSALLAERRGFLLRDRAVSRAALGVSSEADGIEIPGQLRRIGGRDILLFATCKRDRCSSFSNVILVDLANNTMHAVSFAEGRSVIVVDGPPDLAEFVKQHCRGTVCDQVE